MGYHILAICDEQIVYSELLIKRWLRREGEFYRICTFSTEEQLQQFAKEQVITGLLVSESYQHLIPKVKAEQYYCFTIAKEEASYSLSEEHENGNVVIGNKRQVRYIYRYQSSDDIYNVIQRDYQSAIRNESREKVVEFEEAKGVQILGIYNPVHRNGQTLFAKALAQSLGVRGKRVLYLSMEEYAGTSGESENKGDLGEVLYYLKQGGENISLRLPAFIQRGQGYDYVEPIRMSHELRRVTCEEWKELLQEIRERSGYEVILLDLDSCIQGLLEVLEHCDKIYMPIRDAVGGEDKRNQFLHNLEVLHRTELQSRMIYEQIPTFEDQSEASILQNLESVVAQVR